jgi:hypothetical protein
MTKNYKALFFLLTIINACTVSKNIKSNQTKESWKATFDSFNGKEKLAFKKQTNSLAYLSSALSITEGSLSLWVNQKLLPNPHKVNHTQLSLEQDVNIQIIGKNAKGAYGLKYPIYENKKININYNINIEVLALANFLINYEDFANIPNEQTFNINGKDIKVKDLYATNLKIANEFKPYLNAKNLQIIKPYFDKKFYLQYANLLLSLETFPHAKIKSNNQFVSEFSSFEDAENFINAFNNLYKEILFDQFLEKYQAFYDEMLLEVSQNIPKQNFITEMEHFYGKEVKSYNLYPSLTLGFSQGFGVGGENMIGNVFACFNKPEKIDNPKDLALGFNNETSLRTICIHEFGHSFINPAIDKVDTKVINSKMAFFEPIKNKMSEQGYSDWKICLYEHFVRANEVIIARLLNDRQKADELFQDNIQNRSFVYLPQIIEKLEYWYNNEYLEKSYEEKVGEIISELQ